jgi:diguanylate cyclase (GGDEF)-like protein
LPGRRNETYQVFRERPIKGPFSLQESSPVGPQPESEFLSSAIQAPAVRTFTLKDGEAIPGPISALDVLKGGTFGEEHIIAVPDLFPEGDGYLRVFALYPDLSAEARELARNAAIGALLCLTAILAAMWPFLKHFVSRPLSSYSHLAMKIAVGEHVRMPAEGAGELGELGRAVNSMADALQHQATVDALTGLYNLRHLSSNLEALIVQAGTDERPLSIIFGDMDNFKQVNDAFGHQAGDRVLRAIGNALRVWAAPSYTCWRLGGEEFVVAMPNVGEAEALVIAADLRGIISALAVPVADTLVRPSISVGVATFPIDETNPGSLLGIADRRMYAAKAMAAQDRNLPTTPVVPAA